MFTIQQNGYKLLASLAFLSAIACAPYTQAKIYSWVDEDGKTHFSDIPVIKEVQEIDVEVASANLSLEVQERKSDKNQSKGQSEQTMKQRSQRSEQSSSDDQDRRPPPLDGDMQESGERR